MPSNTPPARILGTSLSDLRATRTSAKWDGLSPSVIPMWVAEMDSTLAPPIAAALHTAVEHSDTGYASHGSELAEAFTLFARRRWAWEVHGDVLTFTDVGVAITETLRRICRPGDAVVITTPVYPSFFDYLHLLDLRVIEVPLLDVGLGGRLDLDGIDAAMRDGARALLLSNPHNPTGTVHCRDTLAAVATSAQRWGVRVIADEIHAPLTLPGAEFTPYLEVADDTAIAVHSASKAWNLAGLKCGLVVGSQLPDFGAERNWSVGHFGVIASLAAYRHGEPWLDALTTELAYNTTVVAGQLAGHAIEYHPGRASYFAWLDCRALGLADPAGYFLDHARVKMSSGAGFGAPGAGWVRLNIGTSPDIIAEAFHRVTAAVADGGGPGRSPTNSPTRPGGS